MEQFPILKQPIQYNNPGVKITPTLFIWHSTDNPEVSAQSHFQYWNTGDRSSSANYVLDNQDIIELIPPGYESWNSGSKGNPISIAAEICEFADPNEFLESMKRARFLWQETRKNFPNVQPVSHAWITQNLGGTTHLDPISYFASHGWPWEMFISYINSTDEGSDAVVDSWKKEIVNKAAENGLLSKDQHEPDETVSVWLLCAVTNRLVDLIKK